MSLPFEDSAVLPTTLDADLEAIAALLGTGVLSRTAADTWALTPGTAGRVMFWGASGLVPDDDAALFWDDTNKRLGIGTAAPDVPLHVEGDGAQIRLRSTTLAIPQINVIQSRPGGTLTNDVVGEVNIFGTYSNGVFADVLTLRATAAENFVTTQASTVSLLTAASGDGAVVERVRIDSLGNILLGTDISSAESVVIHGTETGITIGGTTFASRLAIHDQVGIARPSVLAHTHADVAAASPTLVYARSRGTEASETIVADDDILARIIGVGFDGTDYERAAQVLFEVDDATPSGTSMGGAISFWTTPTGSTTLVERGRFQADGRLSLAQQLVSTLATGTAPLAVSSTTLNTNLNADLLDGSHGAAFLLLAGRAGTANHPVISTDDDGTIYGSGTTGKSLRLRANDDNTTTGQLVLDAYLNLVPNPVLAPTTSQTLIDMAPAQIDGSGMLAGNGIKFFRMTVDLNDFPSTFFAGLSLEGTIHNVTRTQIFQTFGLLESSIKSTCAVSGKSPFFADLILDNTVYEQTAGTGTNISSPVSLADLSTLQANGASAVLTANSAAAGHATILSRPMYKALGNSAVLNLTNRTAIYIDTPTHSTSGSPEGAINLTNNTGVRVVDQAGNSTTNPKYTVTNIYNIRADQNTKSGVNALAFYAPGTAPSRFIGGVMVSADAALTNASVGLEVQSTTKALLVSRMTTTQRDALTAVNGMIIYNTTTGTLQGRQGGAWTNL